MQNFQVKVKDGLIDRFFGIQTMKRKAQIGNKYQWLIDYIIKGNFYQDREFLDNADSFIRDPKNSIEQRGEIVNKHDEVIGEEIDTLPAKEKVEKYLKDTNVEANRKGQKEGEPIIHYEDYSEECPEAWGDITGHPDLITCKWCLEKYQRESNYERKGQVTTGDESNVGETPERKAEDEAHDYDKEYKDKFLGKSPKSLETQKDREKELKRGFAKEVTTILYEPNDIVELKRGISIYVTPGMSLYKVGFIPKGTQGEVTAVRGGTQGGRQTIFVSFPVKSIIFNLSQGFSTSRVEYIHKQFSKEYTIEKVPSSYLQLVGNVSKNEQVEVTLEKSPEPLETQKDREKELKKSNLIKGQTEPIFEPEDEDCPYCGGEWSEDVKAEYGDSGEVECPHCGELVVAGERKAMTKKVTFDIQDVVPFDVLGQFLSFSVGGKFIRSIVYSNITSDGKITAEVSTKEPEVTAKRKGQLSETDPMQMTTGLPTSEIEKYKMTRKEVDEPINVIMTPSIERKDGPGTPVDPTYLAETIVRGLRYSHYHTAQEGFNHIIRATKDITKEQVEELQGLMKELGYDVSEQKGEIVKTGQVR